MHPWVWLNEPQHSGAMQAVVGLLFGLPTLAFLSAATFASFRQARAADRQAKAADAQADAANAQVQLTLEALLEETRPYLRLERVYNDEQWNYERQQFRIRNAGRGTANNIIVNFMARWGEPIRDIVATEHRLSRFVLAAGQDMPLPLEARMFSDIEVHCTSVRGKHFMFNFNLTVDNSLVGCIEMPDDFVPQTAPTMIKDVPWPEQ